MDLYRRLSFDGMTAFLIATTLWMALLLGGWILVGRTLGRGAQVVNEASGSRVRGRDGRHAAPARLSAASSTPPHSS